MHRSCLSVAFCQKNWGYLSLEERIFKEKKPLFYDLVGETNKVTFMLHYDNYVVK